ncbi:MAG TPA: lysophospholipid acyltransferase family protein [Polyangiaceae bacterium]|nr:lysophospholipid acyltransferase family protein [Polyangiaceae bacterium]
MRQKSALVRLSDVALNDVMPFARRIVQKTRQVVDDLALRALGPDFEERSARVRSRYDDMGGDPFGLDLDFTKYPAMVGAALHRLYFRTTVHGIENVPEGRALLISNHSGQLPIDGMMIAMTMLMDAEPPRVVRSMVEKWVQTLPFVSMLFNRTGQVVGVPENCARLLEQEELILAFPEGTRGISKPFTRRYQLEEFGLGFMRLAIEARAPIVPVAVIGAEEQFINVGNMEWLAKALGVPVLPVVPQFLVPGGMMPLPTKYHIYFGEPLHFDGDPDDDDAVMEEKVWLVRQTIQSMINRGLKERKSLFF